MFYINVHCRSLDVHFCCDSGSFIRQQLHPAANEVYWMLALQLISTRLTVIVVPRVDIHL